MPDMKSTHYESEAKTMKNIVREDREGKDRQRAGFFQCHDAPPAFLLTGLIERARPLGKKGSMLKLESRL
jgi:hypothetical protein